MFLRGFIFTAACGALFLTPMQAAHAEKYKRLTEANVTAFVEEATEMTSGKALNDMDSVVDFLEHHLTKDARFKSIIKFSLPGFPAQETALALDKDDYINNIKDGTNALEDHESKVRVKSVQVTSSQKQATVVTEGYETGTMPIPNAAKGTTDYFPVEGSTKCNQIVRLSKKGVIQMYNAVCETDIRFIGDTFDMMNQ